MTTQRKESAELCVSCDLCERIAETFEANAIEFTSRPRRDVLEQFRKSKWRILELSTQDGDDGRYLDLCPGCAKLVEDLIDGGRR